MNRIVGIVASGLVSGSAYLAAQAVDIAITGARTDDRVLLGGLAPVEDRAVRPLGTAMHLANAVAFSAVFRMLVRDRLSGPMWWRGVLFASVESAVLYPILLFDEHHPAISAGQLDSYLSVTAFAQQAWRHAVLGAVLGTTTPARDD